MSKLRPLHVIVAGIAMIVIISFVFAFLLLLGGSSKKKVLNDWDGRLQTEMAKAAERPQAEAARARAEAELKDAQAAYHEYAKTKTVPLNNSKLPFYLVALWHEYRNDFADRLDVFMDASPVEVLSPVLPDGAQFAPPMAPPPLEPGGFLALPPLQLVVRGSYPEIKEFMLRLSNFDRALMLLSSVSLQAQGADVVATIPVTPYLIVEQPPGGGGAVGAAAPGAPGAAPPMPRTGAPPAAGGGGNAPAAAAPAPGGADD